MYPRTRQSLPHFLAIKNNFFYSKLRAMGSCESIPQTFLVRPFVRRMAAGIAVQCCKGHHPVSPASYPQSILQDPWIRGKMTPHSVIEENLGTRINGGISRGQETILRPNHSLSLVPRTSESVLRSYTPKVGDAARGLPSWKEYFIIDVV